MNKQRASTPFDLDQSELESMEQIMQSFQEAGSQNQTDTGEIVQARVIDFDDKDVFFDVGLKQDGRCPAAEFDNRPAIGDEIPVVIMEKTGDSMIGLSRLEARKRISWKNLLEAEKEKTTLSGKIAEVLKQGYIVESDGLNLFMPLSQSNLKSRLRNRFPAGKEIIFKIIDIKDRHHSAVISHRQILEERNDEKWRELLSNHKPGDIVEAEVIKRVSFGVFLSVCGIEGLLHSSDISWKKNASFKNQFQVSEKLSVVILEMDAEANRLSLGLKQLTEDPWLWAARELAVGDIIEGTVTSVTDYGAFIEIKEGIEGLAHVSELSWAKRQKHPKSYVSINEIVHAEVLALDCDEHRISLGLKQLQQDPWEQLQSTVKIGDIRKGKITSVTKFGAFVEIIPEIEGLIHFKDYTWEDRADHSMIKKGEEVEFKILEMNSRERKVGCGIKQLTKSPYQLLGEKYKKGSVIDGKIKSITKFGLFVEIGDGFEGLVHLSRLPENKNDPEKLEEFYKKGDEIKTVLQNIDANKQKISLSIKAFEQKQSRDLMKQYMKKDDSPSTNNSFAAFFKDKVE